MILQNEGTRATGKLHRNEKLINEYYTNKVTSHLITGTIINSKIVTATRSEISRAYEVISKPGKAHIFDERLQPAIVTKSLLALSEPSVKDLVRFVGYQETSVSYINHLSQTSIAGDHK